MKRGARYRFAGTWRRVASAHVMTLSNRYAWHCPSCAKPLMVGKKDEEEFVEWSEYAKGEEPEIEPGEPLRPDGTPLRVQVKWKSADPKLKCRHCGEAMVRPMQKRVMKETYISEHEDMQIFRSKRNEMNESKEKISWGMDLAIRHFHKRLKIDLFIADEIHQLKAGDSAQGLSFGTVAECSKHVISLTGTLTGGRASDIFHILWRTAVQTMKQEGFTHKSESRFSKRYGVFQEIVRQQEEYGSQSRRRKEKVTTKELPGLSPHLYYLIMDSLISLELENLGLPLVKLNEKAEFVEMNAKTLKAYTKFDEHLQSSARQRTRDGQRGAWSNYIPGTITKADMPFVPDEYLEEKIDGRIPRDLIYKKQFNEKEKKLVEMVAKERKEGRRVMVYTTYVGKFRHAERLAYVLQQAGFKAAELKAVNAERRMEQIDEMVEDGVEVVVLNMKLVEVGMDLLNFPTIIYFQLNDHISTVRQAARRAWRLGQTRECRVFYLVWKETYQTKQFQRTMMKRAHAMLLEGRIDKSSLAEFGSSDVHASLTKTIVDAIGDVDDLAKKWESLAAKDIPKGVEMMEENELADALKKAFQELGDETRILCGQKPLHSIPASKKKKVYQAVLEESKTEAKSLADVISAVQSSLFQTGVVQATPSSQKSKKRIASSNDKSVQLSLL